jgi:predicted transcriptional regulator
MEKKYGVNGTKVKAIINRWEKLGMAKVENGSVTIENPDFDEGSMIVYTFIKSKEGVTKHEIEMATGITGPDMESALHKLKDQEKIQELPGGKYDIKLNDEEMNHISPVEDEILDVIENYSVREFRGVRQKMSNPGTYTDAQIKDHLRILTLKRRIFKGPLSDYLRLTINNDQPLSEGEKNLLGFMREYPMTDANSLYHEWPNVDRDEIIRNVEKLAARSLLVITDHDEIRLNTNKLQPLENAKGHTKLAGRIMEVLNDHYYTYPNELSGQMPGYDYYFFSGVIDKYMDKGLDQA